MSRHESSDNQPKKRSRAGIIFLVVLLLLTGGAGYIYYSAVKAPLSLDDPQAMAASVPMSPSERFRFMPEDQTVQVKLDASDIWSVLLEHTGKDFLDTINAELSPYSLTISGCGIHMDGDGLRLDAELFYKDTRLVVKMPCNLEITGRRISLIPAGVKLGVLPLPVGGLLSNLKLEYDLSLPVLSDVTQVAFAEDAILLTGPMGQDFHLLIPQVQNLYQAAVFCESMKSLADTLYTEAGSTVLLSHLEQDPGSVEDLYRELFILTDPENSGAYLEIRHGLTERFFPGIDFSAAAEEHTTLSEQLASQNLILEKFFNLLVNDYNEKNFRLSDGEFLKKNKPFQAASYGGKEYEELFQMLDPESFFLVLVHMEDGFIRNTSSFYRICDEDQQFTQEVDFNQTYILGCVLRSVDGDPFLMYETEIREGSTYSRNTTLVPLTEEEISALQVPGKFGIWTG